jgi:ubiquinone/menaquinone biosynthesis C-methylase UbiE
MEKFPSRDSSENSAEQLKKKFDYYLKDFPLTEEDLQKPLLDVGTGKGEFIQYLREVLGNKEAIGIEKQEWKLSQEKEGLIVGDGFDIPFDNESFDIVIAHNYLPMFVGNPSKMQDAILELLRVTKKGGRVMGDIHTPETVVSSNNDDHNALGEEYGELDEKWFQEQREGAEDLQLFLQKLDREYEVEIVTPSGHPVVIIRK